MPERIWHPISKLKSMVVFTNEWVIESRDSLALLEQARPEPHRLTTADVERVKKVHAEAPENIQLFEEQAAKWGELANLSANQRANLATLNMQLAELRTLNRQILDLADELATGTIDTVLAMSDAEVGLAALLGVLPRDLHR